MSPSLYPAEGVDIVDIRQNPLEISLVKDIYRSLQPSEGTRRSLPTVLLYDARGLKLFEEITYLDEYYLTNAEIDTLSSHAKKIVERIPDHAQLVELGSGNLRKVELLLKEFETMNKNVDYYAVDLSLSELQRTFSNIRTENFSYVRLHGLYGTYDDALAWLSTPENRNRPTAVLSLGSSLGNFSRPEAAKFLASFAKVLTPSDVIVIGLDACKDPEKVFKAYNDANGVTRKFYENGLRNANFVLGFEAFKPAEWDIVTRYDAKEGCHVAFYSPRKDVNINGIIISEGEEVIFEEAFKYDARERERLWRNAGLISQVELANRSGNYHVHILSSAALHFPKEPLQYASHTVPSLEDFQSLWTSWDVVTRAMVPRQELLSKPINLRNALIFYLGHIPTFLEPENYQLIFERGIDPDVEDPEKCHSHSQVPDEWPPIDEILDYQVRVRERVRSIFKMEGLSQNRCLGEALFIGFEHEAMHLETFLYMLLQSDETLPPPAVDMPDFEGIFRRARQDEKPNKWFTIPEQTVTVGLDDLGDDTIPDVSFGWDNEKPRRTLSVHSFEAQARPITNGEFAKYLQTHNIRTWPASWVPAHSKGSEGIGDRRAPSMKDFRSKFAVRTVFGPVPLEFAQDWPVIASYDELAGYANWRACRLPTYEEARSIYKYCAHLKQKETMDVTNGHPNGTNGVNGGNGNADSTISPANTRSPDHQPVQHTLLEEMPVFIDLNRCNVGFEHWHPIPVIQNGDKLAGQCELGGVWEWTSTPLTPHDGFKAMDVYPGYTADFFDGKHHIVLGGSWATHPQIAGRTTFVNWYQHNYPYAWAGARLVRDI
ncbi:hypothetical protein MPDQ_000634 [Monascus purpureus]|uniref:Ergothioneine biosynthesis protein 1 n=1 Tax=Monascus purpureus TaxID=5098 RepID=A0A507QPH4_MONPU|nr:hypothetical protein MPDQ_000634 [Monascus purpureus]